MAILRNGVTLEAGPEVPDADKAKESA